MSLTNTANHPIQHPFAVEVLGNVLTLSWCPGKNDSYFPKTMNHFRMVRHVRKDFKLSRVTN